jgi:hypothetical protein
VLENYGFASKAAFFDGCFLSSKTIEMSSKRTYLVQNNLFQAIRASQSPFCPQSRCLDQYTTLTVISNFLLG